VVTNSLRIAVSNSGTPAFVAVAGREDSGQSVPMLGAAFGDARFVFLAADPAEAVPADVDALGPERWCRVDRDALLADPRTEMRRVCDLPGSPMTRRRPPDRS
jgi:hypothetical protein